MSRQRNVQYYHEREFEQFTVAVKGINAESLLLAAQVALTYPSKNEYTLQVGVAYCHPGDQFVKKTGRELALSRLKPQSFEVRSINYDYNDRGILFSLESEKMVLNVLYKEGKYPFLIECFISNRE